MAEKKIDRAGQSLKEAGIQRFEVQEVHRSQLKNAPYNPRVITDQERKKLRGILEANGHVAPITWNQRTGNIVGGHQRLSITDDMMGTDDYRLDVAVIDVDDAQEKAINVALNNTAAMGQFDLEALRGILEDENVKLAATGFDTTDLIRTFGDDIFEDRSEDLAEFTEKLKKVADQFDSVMQKNLASTFGEKYLVFVFPDSAHVDALIQANALPDNRYQNGMILMDKFGVPMPKAEG